MDGLTPLHLLLLAAVVAVFAGPARAGRLAGRVVAWLRAYRRLSSGMTPAGLVEQLARAALTPSDKGPVSGA